MNLKRHDWICFAKFAMVGFSGTGVNLAVVTVAQWIHLPLKLGIAAAILIALFSNFTLNRYFTFAFARNGHWYRQLAGFAAASAVGAAVNYATTLSCLFMWPVLTKWPQIAALAGIASGLIFNYPANRYWVFAEKELGPAGDDTR